MAHHESQEERQQRRSVEELQRGLDRRDAELAVNALIKLDAPSRASHLEGAARLFRDEVRKAHAGAQWGRLVYWAARAEREPALIASGAAVEEQLAVRWCLFGGCARAKEWVRARTQLEALKPALDDRAPTLGQALDAWIVARGNPEPEAFQGLALPALPSPDPRLGYDRGQSSPPPRPPAAPERLEDVEGAVFSLCATLPWRAFAESLDAWASAAPLPVARAIRFLAAPLAVRSLLEQAARGERGAFEPVHLLARLCREERFPEELREELLLAFRVVASAIPKDGLLDVSHARAFAALAQVAAGYPDLRELVSESVSNVRVGPEVRPTFLPLIEHLFGLAPSAPLWAKGARYWASTEKAMSPPRWLSEGLTGLVERGDELAAWLKRCEPLQREEILAVVGEAFSPERVERLIVQAWEGATEELRGKLAGVVRALLRRSQPQTAPESRAHEVLLAMAKAEGIPEHELHKLLKDTHEGRQLRRLMEDELGDDELDPVLAPKALALWHRLQDRVLPYHIELLEVALANAGSPAERERAVERFLGQQSRHMEARIDLLRLAGISDLDRAHEAIRERTLLDFRDDVISLARGFKLAVEKGAPAQVATDLAAALLNADATRPAARADWVAKALREARRLAKGPKRRSTQPKKTAGKAPRKKKAPTKQQTLFGEPES